MAKKDLLQINNDTLIDNSISVSKFDKDEFYVLMVNTLKGSGVFSQRIIDCYLDSNSVDVASLESKEQIVISNKEAIDIIAKDHSDKIDFYRQEAKKISDRKRYLLNKISKTQSEIESLNQSILDSSSKIPSYEEKNKDKSKEIRSIEDKSDILAYRLKLKTEELSNTQSILDGVLTESENLDAKKIELSETIEKENAEIAASEEKAIELAISISKESASVRSKEDNLSTMENDIVKLQAIKRNISPDKFVGNDRKSKFFRKKCKTGTGSVVEYIVNQNTFFAKTKKEANKLADEDIIKNGQVYANKNGNCTK